MSRHIEPDKRPGKRQKEAPDTTSSVAPDGLGSEATRQLFRYYNPSTGKCDLTEEQADERERRREIYNREVDGELEHRRQERQERWRNTPLDPQAKEALGVVPPALVWDQVQCLVFQAFDAYPEHAEELMVKYQPEYDQESLSLMMQNLNPAVGINNFVEVNSDPKLNLQDLQKSPNPPHVLETVLFMVTLSSKWLSEVAR